MNCSLPCSLQTFAQQTITKKHIFQNYNYHDRPSTNSDAQHSE